MKWIKFLKAYDKYKENEIVEVDEKTATSLIELKMAEITESPTNDIISEAMSKFSKGFETVLEKAVSTTVEKLGKVIEARIPAQAKDHDSEKSMGFKSAGDFMSCVMKAGLPNGGIDQRLKGTPSGQSAQIDTEGGYLIPEVWSNRLSEYVYGEDSFIGQTDRRSTSSDNLNVNGMEETSRKDGYRHSGMLGYWMDEADIYTSSTLKFKRIKLVLNKLGALAYVTEEEMADSAYALEPILTRKAGDAINFLVNLAFIDGTGAGQPLGLLRAPSLISVPVESDQPGAAGKEIEHRNIRKMYARMHSKLRAGAVWLVHPNLEEKLEFISFNDDATNQRPIYMPANAGVNSINQKGYSTLYGRPVIPCEFCYDLGQKGDIIFVNWSQYLTLTKAGGGITSNQSMHVRFLYDERAFKFTFRVDGQSGWSSPIEDYRGTKTRSHIVTLAARSSEGTSSGL